MGPMRVLERGRDPETVRFKKIKYLLYIFIYYIIPPHRRDIYIYILLKEVLKNEV